jgi:hypothetical protein
MLATDEELKELIVKRLGLVDEVEFERIRVGSLATFSFFAN